MMNNIFDDNAYNEFLKTRRSRDEDEAQSVDAAVNTLDDDDEGRGVGGGGIERSDDDNAFLMAIKRASVQKMLRDGSIIENTTSSSSSSNIIQQTNAAVALADDEFLAAMRGSLSLESQPSLVSGESADNITPMRPNMMMTKSESLYNTVEEEEGVRSNVPVSMRRNREGTTASNRDDRIACANAAFLGALRAESVPSDEDEGRDHGHFKSSNNGSFIMNAAKIHRPTIDTPQGSLDTDTKFLMAIHGSQSLSSRRISSFVDDGGGTLVITPSSGKVPSDTDTSNNSFMVAIHASADDDDDGAAAASAEGGTDTSSLLGRETKDEDNGDDILDEDILDIKIPNKPFMEKTYFPCPLFFGHVVPPRITAEAERAAAEYLTMVADQSEESGNVSSTLVVEQQLQQSVSLVNNDTESFNADDSSVVSSMSISSLSGLLVGGGRLFEPSVSPCCRNLEGALDVFGFGINPFTRPRTAPGVTNENAVVKEGCDYDDGLNMPHPYVSIYSPVWDEWSTAARAKVRRRKGRVMDAIKVEGEVAARKAVEQAAKHTIKKSSGNQQHGRRAHRKTASMDFFESLQVGSQSFSSLSDTEDTVSSSTLPSAGSSNVFQQKSNATDMFLHYACTGLANDVTSVDDGMKSIDNLPSSPTHQSYDGFSQDQFLKYARGSDADVVSDDPSGTFVGGKGTPLVQRSTLKKDNPFAAPMPGMDSNTFVEAVKNSNNGESDNDFIEVSEERRFVGINDNISAAAAMLAGLDGVDDNDDAYVDRGIGTMFMAAGGGARAANNYGRPYSNFELTNGVTPHFCCDDPALPHESDLGVFETKEEEKRSAERRHEQNMIDEFVSPGIMPHVACPTQCLDVDDSTSWNARFVGSDLENRATGNNTMILSLDGNLYDDSAKVTTRQQPVYEVSRIAWWNFPDNARPSKEDSKARRTLRGRKRPSFDADLFAAWDNPMPLDVHTNLWPQLSLLCENNISGSRCHTATSTARLLPHLSDRPPCVRYLQIDTTAVGFPKLGGEIEPMFCKLAIYHFETKSERSAGLNVPSRNRERCGRVTECLSFDIVQDLNVIQNCKKSLWPYADESNIHGLLMTAAEGLGEGMHNDLTQTEGTSCGIFPLPASTSVSNLYAVIIVHKVIGDNPSQIHPYYKPDRRESCSQEAIDLVSLRSDATEKCNQYGQFITPFAFGVVPLKHIIADESVKIPASRAVQIPLFKFDPARGEQSIFDHILLMLHPRAEPKGGKVASMTRGHALLVMRYFGFLGLHSILKKKSSLAREHLVDFTGELMVKCKTDKKDGDTGCSVAKCPVLGEVNILPPWRSHYKVEPAVFGGRIVKESIGEEEQLHNEITPAKYLYAQEIAALPLEQSDSESKSGGRGKSSNRCKFDGKFFHTSLCNELVCQPKILKYCLKKNITIKIELRELIWNDALNADIALPISPSIHNTRRGPWLVQEAFASCAMGIPEFLDEFKIKLPLILGASGRKRYGLLFSVFHFDEQTRKRTRNVQFPSFSKPTGGESHFSIERLGSGFLPLTLENVPTCLIANGNHNVHIKFHTRPLSNERGKGGNSPGTGRDCDELTTPLYTDEHYPTGSIALIQMPKADDENSEQSNDADENSLASSGVSSYKDNFGKNIILQVTVIAFTSVHPQNKALADLFLTKPSPPRCLMPSDFSEPYAAWGKTQSEIQYRLKPERIPPFNYVGGALAETERKLLDPVLCLTKSSKCPHSDLLTHLIRVVAQLWRTAVSGAGEPSFLWASPESLIPLRLNAFATLLHTVSSASHHMATSGLRQLDGSTMWDLPSLGKLLSLLFDERALFGGPLEIPVPVKINSPSTRSISKPEVVSKDRRARSTSVVPAIITRPSIVARYTSEESPKIFRIKAFDVDAMLKPSITLKSNDVSGIDDINLLTSGAAGFKVDSKNDFMSALNAFLDPEPGILKDTPEQKITPRGSESTFKSGIHPAANRRRWNTLPLKSLATIQENDTERALGQSNASFKEGESIESELILHPGEKEKKSRQFRVPQFNPNSIVELMPRLANEKQAKAEDNSSPTAVKQRTLPTDDTDIETAGTAFLDAISKTMGLGDWHAEKEFGGEESRVGAAHHRKTRSKCSIDWSLPPADMLLEKDQRIEEFNRNRLGNLAPAMLPLSPIVSFPDVNSSNDGTASDDSSDDSSGSPRDAKGSSHVIAIEKGTLSEHPLKRHMSSKDESNLAESILLPDFADRMSSMKNCGEEKRWWPYVYEVIIYQWVALLDEQTKKAEGDASIPGLSPIVIKYLAHAAKSARGATIRCSPFLLEIVIQSLSWRIDSMFRLRKKLKPSSEDTTYEDTVPPLVKLDDNILSALEKLITMLMDASIDSRNFDSLEYRKISVDVNDAVVRFIRDLFSILDVHQVHKLVLVYFSRFVIKEGKHWHDRDSKVTGLRCSWETTKLRLNAITLFVRFPGFMAVCPPLIESWTLPQGTTADVTRRFYSEALEKINSLGLSELTASDGPVRKDPILIPKMKPHWLAEICTDICLSATGHAEQSIQFRASSLLFEIFWRHSQEGRVKGNVSVVASMYVPFLSKLLSHVDYLSSLPPKGQIRKDIIPCILLILQSAPTGIMRELWRKLAKRAEGKTLKSDCADKYGGIVGSGNGIGGFNTLSSAISIAMDDAEIDVDEEEPDIFGMFGLLNLSLSTIEYECSGNQRERNVVTDALCDEKPIWRMEFLLSNHVKTSVNPRGLPFNSFDAGEGGNTERVTTSMSRKWHAHDCAMVIINICRQIVREILHMLKPQLSSSKDAKDRNQSLVGVTGSRSLSDILLPTTNKDEEFGNISGDQHEEGKAARVRKRLRQRCMETLEFSVTDSIIVVRAAASVYLHALSMKQSDVVVTRTLTAAIEVVKIFGVKLFLAAVGETLQHWMRVVLEHCGARRAELRVEACEFLNLVLRLTYDSYGSFTRVRIPLLSVQSEVMERIVAKASRKYAMEQRRLDLVPISLSNDGAEASLTPLWRTIDRLHNQSASQNLSFKSALARLAVKMKTVYRAYLAAHALAIVNRSESRSHDGDNVSLQTNPYVQKMRVSVHRIVSNSAWFSKRFLGTSASGSLDRSIIQIEAVEDSFLIAADVFSSTELPSHRIAWLQKLAEFHRMRGRFAEEATCRCKIYHTYREASKLHDHIWCSSPFLPWASSSLDGTDPDGEGHAIVSDFEYDMDNLSGSSKSGKQLERGNAFRRIFYRAADSVRVRTGDWGAVSGGKYLFYGITLKSEFDSVSPWYSQREMEENMVEEAELSGDLFLRAGIVESSRYAWSLANLFYSETFNYARLAYVYRRLALVVTSQVPIIDFSNQLDLSSSLGRFYKVYFHGGAPDDLLSSQGSGGFVYRVPNNVQIKSFAKRLEETIRCILPQKTIIDLLLDDGSPTTTQLSISGKRPSVIGGAPIEPVKIKVTPLRPLYKVEDDEKCFRGTPEWFQLRMEDRHLNPDGEGNLRHSRASSGASFHRRISTLSIASNSLSSVGSATMVSTRRSTFRPLHRKTNSSRSNPTHELDNYGLNGDPIGADKFYFTQPMRKDPIRGFRDWLKVPREQIAERSLRVTELQVENSFPACITRQQIIHRAVFTQSPLEASVEAVSTWCSVLFRTVIATNGQCVLGVEQQQGISSESAKLVMECIHSSGIKQLGTTFLSTNTPEVLETPPEESVGMSTVFYSSYESLSEEEIERVQAKLARMIVTFLDLLHLLIARNRDILLTVVQARKQRSGDNSSVASCSIQGYTVRPPTTSSSPARRDHSELSTVDNEQAHMYEKSQSEIVGGNRSILAGNPEVTDGHGQSNISDRTDSAIGVQSELQRGLTSLVRSLTPYLLDTLTNEVPKWMRYGCHDNYFSSGQYRQADIPIGDELFFNQDTSEDDADDDDDDDDDRASKCESSYAVPRSIRGSSGHMFKDNSPSGSMCSVSSDRRSRFDRTMSTISQRPPIDDRSNPHSRGGT